MKATAVIFLIVLVVMCGCLLEPGNEGVDCAAYAAAGVNLTITDSSTSLPAGMGALVVAKEGDFSDTLEVQSDSSRAVGLWERAGTYEITVTKKGYRDWSKSNVVVEQDECHVIPVTIDVLLIPEG